MRLTHNLINDFILPDHAQFFPRDFFYREGVCFQPVNLNFDLGIFFLQRFVALFERAQFLLKFAHCQKTVFIEHGGPYHRHKQREAHYQDALGATQIHGDPIVYAPTISPAQVAKNIFSLEYGCLAKVFFNAEQLVIFSDPVSAAE